jgi:hypothetical protein
LREGHRLKFFENWALRKIFGPKKEEVTGEWRSINDEDLYFVHFSQNIAQVIKPRRMGWAGRVARVGDMRFLQILLGRPEGETT